MFYICDPEERGCNCRIFACEKQGKRSVRLISDRYLFGRIRTTDLERRKGETTGKEFRTKGEII